MSLIEIKNRITGEVTFKHDCEDNKTISLLRNI